MSSGALMGSIFVLWQIKPSNFTSKTIVEGVSYKSLRFVSIKYVFNEKKIIGFLWQFRRTSSGGRR